MMRWANPSQNDQLRGNEIQDTDNFSSFAIENSSDEVGLFEKKSAGLSANAEQVGSDV
jgi:hypothetical protein